MESKTIGSEYLSGLVKSRPSRQVLKVPEFISQRRLFASLRIVLGEANGLALALKQMLKATRHPVDSDVLIDFPLSILRRIYYSDGLNRTDFDISWLFAVFNQTDNLRRDVRTPTRESAIVVIAAFGTNFKARKMALYCASMLAKNAKHITHQPSLVNVIPGLYDFAKHDWH